VGVQVGLMAGQDSTSPFPSLAFTFLGLSRFEPKEAGVLVGDDVFGCALASACAVCCIVCRWE